MIGDLTIPEKVKRENHNARDGLYTAVSAIEYGYVLACFTALVKANIKGLLFESVFWLEGTSHILMDSFSFENHSVNKIEANSVLAGASDSSVKSNMKGGLNDLWKTLKEYWKKALIAGIPGGLALGGGVGAGYFFGTAPENREFEKELRSL